MKKMLVGGLSIVGMVMLVGCGGGGGGGGSTPSGPSDPSSPSNPVENTDTLKITKSDNEHFTIQWNKGYAGNSSVIYRGKVLVQMPGMPSVTDMPIMSSGEKGIYTLECALAEGPEAFYECEESVSTEGALKFFHIGFVKEEDYTIHRLYGTEDQGVDYIMNNTSGTLTIE